MPDIDFLPVQYSQRQMLRHWQPWRVLVAAAFSALLAAASLSQYRCRQRAEEELAELAPQYEAAVRQNARLAEIQSQLVADRAEAELFTYLRHPWPRTQLLHALVAALPEQITIQNLQITREVGAKQAPADARARSQRGLEEADLKKLLPAERDLRQLRDKWDQVQTVIRVSGIAAESGACNRYLENLVKASMFSKVELDSVETVQGKDEARTKLAVILTVRPGYGQPGGPTGPKKDTATRPQRRTL